MLLCKLSSQLLSFTSNTIHELATFYPLCCQGFNLIREFMWRCDNSFPLNAWVSFSSKLSTILEKDETNMYKNIDEPMNQSQSDAWARENVEISRNPDGGSPNDSSEVGCPHPLARGQGGSWISLSKPGKCAIRPKWPKGEKMFQGLID